MVRRVCLAGRVIAAAAALLLVGGPPAALADAGLGPAHVGVTLHAPAAPAVGGGAAATVRWTWRRCRRYADQIEADGPSAYWRLGDGSADLTGHASLTPAGTPGTSGDGALTGEQDPAATFDGTGAAFTGLSPVDVTGVNPYTLEVWVRPRQTDGRTQYLMALESSTAGAGRQGTGVWLSSAGLGFERVTDGQASTIVYRAGLPVGQWSHVVTSYDGGVMRLFVNGQQVGSRATDTPLRGESDTVSLAATNGGQAGFFAGALDEAAVYDHAVIRSHVAVHQQVATTDPCSTITAATGPDYAPTYADLDDTLEVTVTATSGAGTQSATAATAGVVLDAAGQAVHLTLDAISAGQIVTGTVPINVTVTGAVPDSIAFDVDGNLRYEKVGEPPYQYTWYTAADPNGHHTITVQAYARRSSTPATVSAIVTVSNATVFPPMLPFGKESMYSEFNQGDSASANAAAVANNLLDNVWPARGFPLVKLGWPLTWTEDPYDDAFWRFYQYSLRPESSLLYMWKTTGDQRYLNKLIAILRSYVAYDQTRPLNTLTFDNNHTAAYRAMTLTNFYAKLRDAGVLPPDLDAGLRGSLAKLGAFLADPRHFEGGYNHGYNEGAALLLIADNFPQFPDAATWRQTAIDRLNGMLTTTLDSDGVEVENSPFYHVYVLGLVYQIAQWAKLYEPALATPYSEAAQRMLRYAAYVTQPSGYLPMLGATATTYMPSQDPSIYGPMAAADPAFQFAYTRGAQGTPPPDGVVLFPASGLFILRSVLGTPANLPQQTYVTFQAGPYRTDHSNLDALGMTMYAAGQTVLPTSGLFTYTQQPDRTYFHGTSAHNTVVVDGGDQAEGPAHAGPHGNLGASSYATGTSDLYAGVHHRRSVVVLRQGLSLVVDQLRGSTTHSYTQTWHLDPSAMLAQSGQDAFVSGAGGNRYLTIRQADPAGETLTALKGQTSPRMAGWYSSAYGHKVPSYQLQYTRTGTSAQFTTLLAAGPYVTQTSTVTEHQVAGGTEVDVCVGGTVGYVVTIPADEAAALAVTGGACPAASG